MNISAAADLSGLRPKTIRYYEDITLVSPARAPNGYRDYSEADIHRLRFLQRARGLGFSIGACRRLLSLYEDDNRTSAQVKAVATETVAEIDRKIAELEALRHTLGALIERCHGDDRPDCPIIDEIADPVREASRGRRPGKADARAQK